VPGTAANGVATDFNRIKDARKNPEERKNFNLRAFDRDKQIFFAIFATPSRTFAVKSSFRFPARQIAAGTAGATVIRPASRCFRVRSP
jgi:hypothetical protein